MKARRLYCYEADLGRGCLAMRLQLSRIQSPAFRCNLIGVPAQKQDISPYDHFTLLNTAGKSIDAVSGAQMANNVPDSNSRVPLPFSKEYLLYNDLDIVEDSGSNSSSQSSNYLLPHT